MHDYTGIIHFHSEYSHDGRASIPDIAAAARENNIDILMLTDHDNIQARLSGQEGWHGDVLLISGEEICTAQFNHYLVFGIQEAVSGTLPEQTSPQQIIDRVRGEGGVGIIAHPDHEGTELFHVKQYAWKDWQVSGFAAMGIWDFMTDWQSALTGYARGMAGYFFPALFLQGPRQVTLKRWDELNRCARITGVGELDNHDTPRKFLGITWSVFPFRKAFRFIRTHFLLETPLSHDKNADIEAVYQAVRKGRIFVSLDYFKPARGFSFTITQERGELQMGDESIFDSFALAHVAIPHHGRICLLRDGRPVAEAAGTALVAELHEKGVYRVEVHNRAWGRCRPWIFSNPIYLR